MEDSISQLRRDYTLSGLDVDEVAADPVRQFQAWFDQAQQPIAAGQVPDWMEANAMTLSTCDADGMPTSRIVLLKGVDEGRFLFYTNYDSTKAAAMAANPRVSLCFYWPHLQRQVRIEGTVSQTDRETSRRYYHTRPRGSQLGAHVSPQSRVVDSRAFLEKRMESLEAEYPEGTLVPLPDNWGGYAVTPTAFEFWQGRSNRLHDRISYTLAEGAWKVERLAP
ncbi:MAG: pyridoxamine 5'-phosphate oxidase [Planctomycetota bacterium]